MIKKILLSSVLIASTFFMVNAQQIWSLEKCIQYARQNSLTMKQAEVGIKNTKLTEKQSRMERMPSLNADGSGGYSFGRTIDPTTNTFQSLSRGTNSFSLGANVTVYNGGRINNTIQQSRLDVAAQKADTEDIANNISLSVAGAYLNILFGEEQLINATKRLQQTQEQLSQTDRLIQAGSLPENERLQILAQIAQNEQQVIAQENNVTISYLNLKNLLQLEPDFDLKVQDPGDIPIPADAAPELFNFKTIYNQALQAQPIIKAGELRIRSAGLEVDIAKSGMLPSLSFFGNIRTDFATGVPDFGNPNLDNVAVQLGDPALFNITGIGDVSVTPYNTTGVTFPDRGYIDQLNDNFGQSVGISLNVPIYNKHRNQINIERARLGILNSQITHEQNKQQLKADIQLAIADTKAAKKQLEAAQRTVDALQASYENTEKKFKLGAANTFEFTSAKNDLDLSKVDLTISKYDYLYKLKIVDFYQGKKITL
ncbi:MAG: outer membrane protein [Saprospiraceae bacterium]|jgi:outer membrane protein